MAWKDINSTILLGRLTRDPELSYTPSQTPVCKFSIANNRPGAAGKEEVNFFDIVAWDKLGTNCSTFLKKGSQVVVEGRLKQERFQDKNGQNRSVVKVIADNIQFLGAKAGGENRPTEAPNHDEPQSQAPPKSIEFEEYPDKSGFEDDGVPF